MAELKKPQSIDINALFSNRNRQIAQEKNEIDNLMGMFSKSALTTDTKEGYDSAIENIDKITGNHSYNKIKGKILKDQLMLEKENQIIFDDVKSKATNLLSNVKGGSTDGMMDLINDFTTSLTVNKQKFNEAEIKEMNESLAIINDLNLQNQSNIAKKELDIPENRQVMFDFYQNIGSGSGVVNTLEKSINENMAIESAQASAKNKQLKNEMGYAGLGPYDYDVVRNDLVNMNAQFQNLKEIVGSDNFTLPISFATENLTKDGKNVLDRNVPLNIKSQYDNAILSFAGSKIVKETQQTFINEGNEALKDDGTFNDEFMKSIIVNVETGGVNKLSERLEKRLGKRAVMHGGTGASPSKHSVNLVAAWKKLTNARSNISDILENPNNPSNSNITEEMYDVMGETDFTDYNID